MEYTTIKLDFVDEHIAVLTFSCPENMNPLTDTLIAESLDALKSVNENTSIRAMIITGAGKAFMAGANLKAIAALSVTENTEYNNRILKLVYDINRLRVPVIAAINGFAFGGGLELALACTIRVASEKAKLGLPEVGLGILPGAGGTQRLPRIIPLGSAMKLLLTGDTINSAEALRLGIVDEVVAHDELLSACIQMAKKIASKAPLSVESIKDCVLSGVEMPLDDAITYTSAKLETLTASDDFQEGVSAFLEKRESIFERK